MLRVTLTCSRVSRGTAARTRAAALADASAAAGRRDCESRVADDHLPAIRVTILAAAAVGAESAAAGPTGPAGRAADGRGAGP